MNPVLSEEWRFIGMHDSQKCEVSRQPGLQSEGSCFCGADIAAAAAAGTGKQMTLCSFSAPAEWAVGENGTEEGWAWGWRSLSRMRENIMREDNVYSGL